jgi:hypothetical protein
MRKATEHAFVAPSSPSLHSASTGRDQTPRTQSRPATAPFHSLSLLESRETGEDPGQRITGNARRLAGLRCGLVMRWPPILVSPLAGSAPRRAYRLLPASPEATAQRYTLPARSENIATPATPNTHGARLHAFDTARKRPGFPLRSMSKTWRLTPGDESVRPSAEKNSGPAQDRRSKIQAGRCAPVMPHANAMSHASCAR